LVFEDGGDVAGHIYVYGFDGRSGKIELDLVAGGGGAGGVEVNGFEADGLLGFAGGEVIDTGELEVCGGIEVGGGFGGKVIHCGGGGGSGAGSGGVGIGDAADVEIGGLEIEVFVKVFFGEVVETAVFEPVVVDTGARGSGGAVAVEAPPKEGDDEDEEDEEDKPGGGAAAAVLE
jgi:hypothetical protein